MLENRPIRIMHIVQSLEVGGLENGVVNLLNRLNDGRFTHAVCCLTHGGKLVERIQSQDVKIIEVGLRTDSFRFPVMRLRRLMRQWAPDIVHTRGWGTIDAIIAARMAGISRVIHGEHGREATDPEGLNAKRNLIRRALSPMVDRFVSVSDDLRRWLTGTVGISSRKVLTIHNGVDTERFSGQSREQSRRQLGLDSGAFVIGIVGRLDPVKDHLTLLTAFAPVAQQNQAARLLIVGDGPERERIEAHAAALAIAGQTLLLGERHDIPMLLKAVDVFALTSIAEGISNTILEAMASALPVVATRVGGNPELIEDKITGRLVAPGDAAELSSTFLSYFENADVCLAHGRAARVRAQKKFSLDRMAADYADLYLTVAAGRSQIAA
jgi:sugar transferase (PEP-CTERM/EpsH1 system associated)